MIDNKIIVLINLIEYNGPNTIFKNRSWEQAWAFDFAFDKKHKLNKSFWKKY